MTEYVKHFPITAGTTKIFPSCYFMQNLNVASYKHLLYVGDGRGESIFGERDDVKHERSDDDVGRRDGFPVVRRPKNAIRTRHVAIVNALKNMLF